MVSVNIHHAAGEGKETAMFSKPEKDSKYQYI